MPLKFNEIFPDDLKCQELCVDIYIYTHKHLERWTDECRTCTVTNPVNKNERLAVRHFLKYTDITPANLMLHEFSLWK